MLIYLCIGVNHCTDSLFSTNCFLVVVAMWLRNWLVMFYSSRTSFWGPQTISMRKSNTLLEFVCTRRNRFQFPSKSLNGSWWWWHFFVRFETNGFLFDPKSEEKLSPRSYSIKFERKLKSVFPECRRNPIM